MRHNFSSLIRHLGVMLVLAASCWLSSPALAASSAEWALSYQGKSTNEFVWDKRVQALVRTRVPARLSDQVLSGLGGPPDPVFVTDHRYVAVAACVPHDCGDKGFFWVDTQTGVGLGAAAAGDKLTIGSNGMSAAGIPQQARRALLDWLSEHEITPSTVDFIGSNGAVTVLSPANFKTPLRYQPPLDGPSFDCAGAANAIDQTICGDTDLKAQDRDLAALYSRIWHGNSTVPARQELRDLQRAWLKQRNDECARAASMRDCLKGAYTAQQDRLMHWIPSH